MAAATVFVIADTLSVEHAHRHIHKYVLNGNAAFFAHTHIHSHTLSTGRHSHAHGVYSANG